MKANLIEAARAALTSLKMSHELITEGLIDFKKYHLANDADIEIRLAQTIEALHTALAAAKQAALQGPECWINPKPRHPEDWFSTHPRQGWTRYTPAAPAQVPLTDEQLLAIARKHAGGTSSKLTRDVGPYEVTEPTHVYRSIARAIERAHGIGGKP